MASKKGEKEEREECEEEAEDETVGEDWETWTDPLEELAEVVDALEVHNPQGKIVLDLGTDCVKPLYLALKYEPAKIIGINEDYTLFPFASDIAEKSKLLTQTEIHFYTCSFFDGINLKKTLSKEKIKDKFNIILISKTLHHLRTGKCIAGKRDSKHRCREDEKCCIYEFKEEEIFKRFFQYGEKVILYEPFYPHEEDNDKVRGRGGHFTIKEWTRILKHLSKNYRVELFKPLRCHLTQSELGKVKEKLRQVDYICFCIEEK